MTKATTYAIIRQRHYYAGAIDIDRRWLPLSGEAHATKASAKAEIEAFDGTVYHQGHGEYSRPTCRVADMNKATWRAAARRERESRA